jgi:elongation factor Ts
MAITAADVKKLRDATGAGMMDAKKALTEANGDFEAATEILRVTGAAKVSSRSDREASNGLVAAAGTTLIQLGAETDFVAKNEEFVALAAAIVDAVQAAGATDVEAAKAATLGDATVEEAVASWPPRSARSSNWPRWPAFEAPSAVYLHRAARTCPRRSASWSSTRAPRTTSSCAASPCRSPP